jgi:hypothetical protein
MIHCWKLKSAREENIVTQDVSPPQYCTATAPGQMPEFSRVCGGQQGSIVLIMNQAYKGRF